MFGPITTIQHGSVLLSKSLLKRFHKPVATGINEQVVNPGLIESQDFDPIDLDSPVSESRYHYAS